MADYMPFPQRSFTSLHFSALRESCLVGSKKSSYMCVTDSLRTGTKRTTLSLTWDTNNEEEDLNIEGIGDYGIAKTNRNRKRTGRRKPDKTKATIHSYTPASDSDNIPGHLHHIQVSQIFSTTTVTQTISRQHIIKDLENQTDHITSEATAETQTLTRLQQSSEENQSTDEYNSDNEVEVED
ncbi:hypothetical protein CHS0354_000083 [Potamilus streckersoni]|uniref:Uncharacterized protein n=1 Tax=Potamilus streckersoni TaxID=2493646 RepID=A0AAE0TIF0_9BIVA|nr:hypothetical protein CHS0354_000083 [Potamilus streckersoni]